MEGALVRSSQELTEEHCQYLTYQILRCVGGGGGGGVEFFFSPRPYLLEEAVPPT